MTSDQIEAAYIASSLSLLDGCQTLRLRCGHWNWNLYDNTVLVRKCDRDENPFQMTADYFNSTELVPVQLNLPMDV